MKIRFFIFSVAAALCVSALSACSDSEPKTRAEAVRRAAEILEGVNDRASADVAAEKYSALIRAADKLGKTSAAEAKAAETAVSALLSQATRLGKQEFFESEALKKALSAPADIPATEKSSD